jgi:hypothetical protein
MVMPCFAGEKTDPGTGSVQVTAERGWGCQYERFSRWEDPVDFAKQPVSAIQMLQYCQADNTAYLFQIWQPVQVYIAVNKNM